MKRLLIQIGSVNGGVGKSFVNFVRQLFKTIEIDLCIFNNSGIFYEDLPNEINRITVSERLQKRSLSNESILLHNPRLKALMKRFIRPVLHRFGYGKKKQRNLIASEPAIQKKYDLAICYAGNDFLGSEFILEKVNAHKKWAIYHGDIEREYVSGYAKENMLRFDNIFGVSKSATEKIRKKFQKNKYKGEIDFLYNFSDTENILKRAKEYKVNLPISFNLVSACRLSAEKAIPRAIDVLGKLKKQGLDFYWTIVGDGVERAIIEKRIIKKKLQDNVALVGMKQNPYPYIAAADLFMLLSLHEAAPMVYAETLTLGVPVLSTRTAAAEEIIAGNGFICDNNEKGIYAALKELLSNRETVANKKKEIIDYSYPNDEIKKKFLEWSEK